MLETKIAILTEENIRRKIKRMACQIWEKNTNQKELTIIGIEKGGLVLAKILAKELDEMSNLKIQVLPLKIDKKSPLKNQPVLTENLNNKNIVLVDDVSNSGKTLMYALKSILQFEPEQIHIAVLVERSHKRFPVSVDIVGHNLSTTLQEHIVVEFENQNITAAYLV